MWREILVEEEKSVWWRKTRAYETDGIEKSRRREEKYGGGEELGR